MGLVADLLKKSIVADLVAPCSPLIGLTATERATEDYVRAYERAGCNWVSFTVAADYTVALDGPVEAIARARNWFGLRPERFVLVERADDIVRAKREGKMAVTLHFQGTLAFQRNLRLVELFKRLGVMHALMAYNMKCFVGDGCHERTDAGLSVFGQSLIAEMNRVGMIVDVSHTGHRTAMDTIEVSTAPVIMSHSLPGALFKHDRNVPDSLIKAVASTGGVIGMNGVGIFMSEAADDASAGRLFEFLDYTVQLVGADHVGFGVDYVMHTEHLLAGTKAFAHLFKGAAGYMRDSNVFASPAVIAELAELMLRRNYRESDVQGVLGANWLRVFRQVCG